MKYTLIIAFLSSLIIFGCKGKNSSQDFADRELLSEIDTFYLGKKYIKVEEITKEYFDIFPSAIIDASEVNLQKDASAVRKVDDTLFIKTHVKELKFVNASDENDYVNYQYTSFLKEQDKFLIFCSYYESHDYMLIDNKNAEITHLWGLPVFSPDNKYIISGNEDLNAAFTDNGVQLFENNNGIKLIAQRELNNWGPKEIKWVEDNVVLVKAGIKDSEQVKYLKLLLN